MESEYTQKEYNIDFIKLLQKYKVTDICTTDLPIDCIKHVFRENSYYQAHSFRTLICELIYQAIQMFPNIKEYRIICKNNKGVSKIIIGYLEELDNDDELGLIKIENKYTTVILDKTDVHNIYIFNRCSEGDPEIINAVLSCLYLDGNQPSVKTEIICLPGQKGKEKF